MALPVLFWQYQPRTWWVKTRNFYSSNSNYHRCKIFTSRYMFSKEAKTIELIRNRLPVSKNPQYPIWPLFWQKCLWYLITQYEINANQCWNKSCSKFAGRNRFFTPRFSPWLQCICSKMTSIKYLGALATRVIKHESFGNVTPAYITYLKSCSVICTDSVAFIVYLNHSYFI